MTIFVGLGKQGALVWQRDPRPQLGLPIPQRGTIGLGLCQVVLQPLLVAQFMRLAKILSFERQRRCVTDLYCENSGQDVRGHFALSSAGYDKPTVTVFRGPQHGRCQADTENDQSCGVATTSKLELIFRVHSDRPRELPARWRTIP
jgi:hypothetical protein